VVRVAIRTPQRITPQFEDGLISTGNQRSCRRLFSERPTQLSGPCRNTFISVGIALYRWGDSAGAILAARRARMAFTSILTGATVQPLVLALLTGDRTEVSFRVILGLAIIALAWIAAGLWLIHVGERNHRTHR